MTSLKRMATALSGQPAWVRGPLVVLLFALVEAVLLGGHVLHGGLYTDDWPYASIQHELGTSGLISNLASANHDRPLAALYQSLATAVSGTNPHWHGLWGLLTMLAAASALYALLRVLAVHSRDAIAILLLFIVFPFADSGWLWFAASHSYLAIALAALGGIVALIGLRRTDRSAIAYHCGAAMLFAASVLTYQLAAAVICLSGLAYIPRVARARALKLWLVDVCTVVLAAGLPRLITGSGGATADPIIPFSQQLVHARVMGDQGLTLLARAIVPFGYAHRNIVLPVALAGMCGGVFLATRARVDSATRGLLRRWLTGVVIGGLIVVAAYVVYVPGPIANYQPLEAGEGNRVNVMAALGYAVIVYALAMIAAAIVLHVVRRPRDWAPYLAVTIAAVVFVGYLDRTRFDIAEWNRAGTIQRQELTALRHSPRPAAYTTLYTFGGVGQVAPGVFVFRVTWDLNSAVQLLWNDATLHAYPIFTGTEMTCTKSQVIPVGAPNGDGTGQAASYGHAVFYDFRNGREQRIANANACARAVANFAPGPVEQ
jgi:hypothetical protein